jgi:hypothetical protein
VDLLFSQNLEGQRVLVFVATKREVEITSEKLTASKSAYIIHIELRIYIHFLHPHLLATRDVTAHSRGEVNFFSIRCNRIQSRARIH